MINILIKKKLSSNNKLFSKFKFSKIGNLKKIIKIIINNNIFNINNLYFFIILNSLKAILEIYKNKIINPPMYKINIIKEIHEVLLIRLIIKVNVIDCNIITKFADNGDFILVNNNDVNKLIKINVFIIQYIF